MSTTTVEVIETTTTSSTCPGTVTVTELPVPPPPPPPLEFVLMAPSEYETLMAEDTIWAWLPDLLAVTSRPVLLWGPPDTGKSWAAKTMALANRKMWAAHLTEDSPGAELRGYERVVGNNMEWADGPMLRAWRGGDRLVVEEIDKAGGDTLTMCLAAADDPRIAQIVLPTGEIVKPKDGYQCVATSNESPDQLSPELKSRFAISIHVTCPPPAAFAALPDELRAIARASSKERDPARRIYMRSWSAFGELLRSPVDPKVAASVVFGPRAPDILAAIELRKKENPR